MGLPKISGFCKMRNERSVFRMYVHEICFGLSATNKGNSFVLSVTSNFNLFSGSFVFSVHRMILV